MRPLTKEWVAKAEADYESALMLYRKRKSPNYDGACFHAQQCAEKYLKARLQEAQIRFSKTHHLSDLLSQVLPVEPLWSGMAAALDPLTDAASSISISRCFRVKAGREDGYRYC
jgi:HEPN domain-containing protein